MFEEDNSSNHDQIDKKWTVAPFSDTRDWQDSLAFERSACFYVTTYVSFEPFHNLTLKQIF